MLLRSTIRRTHTIRVVLNPFPLWQKAVTFLIRFSYLYKLYFLVLILCSYVTQVLFSVSPIAPKHTPFCRPDCSSQHHKLLLSLLRCSNYNYGAANIETFMKQVNKYVTEIGKFAELRANADLPDPVDSFKYPLVHWVCVLGKFRVLEKLAGVKEFNLGVQSERTGDTALHRMLLSLDRVVVLRKSSVKTILQVFRKTLRTLTDSLPCVITLCSNEGDTPFHCLAKVILDCRGELEKMNTYEGYFEYLIKELTHLKTTGKLTPEAVRELLLKTNNSKETFLHILACRHGVGHRVIKSVLKNIEPEVMDVLKETKDADGKTPSDLAEDLCSYEMAAILRPRDQEASVDVDGPEELPQTPDKSSPSQSPDVQSPPATLFHPMEYAMSPFVPDGAAAARMQLFPVKREPDADDGAIEEPSRESPVEVNNTPCTTETTDYAPLCTVKQSPGRAHSTPTTSANAEIDVMASSANGSTATESMLATSITNNTKATVSPNNNVSNVPMLSSSLSGSTSSSSPTILANQSNVSSVANVSVNHSRGASVSPTSTSHSRATNSPTVAVNDKASDVIPRVSPLPAPWSERRGREEERPWERGCKASSPATISTNHSRSTSASITSANQSMDTSSPTVNVEGQNNNKESSVLSGIMTISQSGRLLNTLQAKFQEELLQTERGLEEKEKALVRTRQRISEVEERRQKLLKELEETWNQIIADTREEGVIQAEIAAKKRDCQRFRTELEKYSTQLKAIKE